ncbi:uncharacterized protein BDZ99DRAFT_525731 [Mytilinidion resinicola]|uniref:F-box domain-containing protein n=1 Tax=Mytilinidion resinicola TaxID=574789 RepID=A0A6A6Y6A3_9PEZI|nr:uncharacterized protein BDZ99DRAFT_525731 [Mytilinidion resinicola]KAF2804139.1 hypothetical protein BDZ99DRAFT_525731 [Mytilinidion resinicola]
MEITGCKHFADQEGQLLSTTAKLSDTFPPTQTFIASLPVELVRMVCNNLDPSDIMSFRRTNKRFGEIGVEHLIPRVSFHLSPASFSRLDTITSHPVLRKHVKEMHFNGQCFTCPTSYWETNGSLFLKEVNWDIYHQEARYKKDPGCDFECTEDGSWSFEEVLLADGADDTLLMAQFDAFAQMLFDTNNPEFLNKYLSERSNERSNKPRFTGVVEPFFREGCSSMEIRKVLQDLSQRVKEHREMEYDIFGSEPSWSFYGGDKSLNASGMYAGVQQLNALLAGCHEAGTRLNSLEVEAVSWRFFAQPVEAFGRGALSLLSKLKMRVVVSTLHDNDIIFDESDECRRQLGHGIMHRFLRDMPLLKDLDLTILNHFGGDFLLKNIVGNITWPRLQSLVLRHIVTEEETLVSLLDRHMVTLKHLSLCDIALTEGEWRSAWRKVRCLVATYGLDNLHIGNWNRFVTRHLENGDYVRLYQRWREAKVLGFVEATRMLHQYLIKGEGSIDEPVWQYTRAL